MSDFPFTAPNGASIASVAQCGGEDNWAIYCTDETAADPTAEGWFDYDSDGPDEPDWETIEFDGEAVFVADDDSRWLARHLVPASAMLPAEAVEIAKRDFLAAIAARMTSEALSDLRKCFGALAAGAEQGHPYQALVGTAKLVADGAAREAEELKRAWQFEARRCAATLLDGYFWSAYDQGFASEHGWELTQYGDGQVCIVADEDAENVAFTGEGANLRADEHVRAVATGKLRNTPILYVALCKRAVEIADESHADRVADEAEADVDD